MKTVNCEDCRNYIAPTADFNDIRKIILKAKCNLGKRIMFRMPKSYDYNLIEDYGYRRRCDQFKPIDLLKSTPNSEL